MFKSFTAAKCRDSISNANRQLGGQDGCSSHQLYTKNYGEVAQSVERKPEELGVGSSILSLTTQCSLGVQR